MSRRWGFRLRLQNNRVQSCHITRAIFFPVSTGRIKVHLAKVQPFISTDKITNPTIFALYIYGKIEKEFEPDALSLMPGRVIAEAETETVLEIDSSYCIISCIPDLSERN